MARASPKVVIRMSEGKVRADKVHSILCNRLSTSGDEEYLVRWASSSTEKPPMSWHSVGELDRCLESIQDYLEVRERRLEAIITPDKQSVIDKKRKGPDSDFETLRRPSPLDRKLVEGTSPLSRTPSFSSTSSSGIATQDIRVYNGILKYDELGFAYGVPSTGGDIPVLNVAQVPTTTMLRASCGSVTKAKGKIRIEYAEKLRRLPGPKVTFRNLHDMSTPSLRFRYIPEYVLGEGVHRADTDFQTGCTQCSPRMGRGIGCEYTKKCDCLEYAAVDESRLSDEERKEYDIILAEGRSTMGLPKKFPYFVETKIRQSMSLVPFYLHSRRPIYECNDKCRCGPLCRNKNVQFGRRVELEIFRTQHRGWGLKCLSDLHEGQFIDTYRGEVITDAEATRREQVGSKAKASYLYSLDKFAETEDLAEADVYVVDGEFMGGPTKFINHSCEPNCRQYTVSYNKHDCRIYDIAFFACKPIPKGTELTFDYLDKDDDEPMDEPGKDAIPCLCGAAKCRKWLWT